jgi:uncharacterized protein YbaP (TraB family)
MPRADRARPVAPFVACLLVAVAASVQAMAQEAAAPAAKCFLWRIRHGTNEGWLFGTFHLATKGLYPLPPGVESAFRRSSSLAVMVDFESLDPEAVRKAYQARGYYPEGDSLWNHLAEETAAEVKVVLQRHRIPEDGAARVRPWYLGEGLYQKEMERLGHDSELALDRHFRKRAGDRPVIGLLSLERGLALTSEGEPFLQELLLRLNLADARMLEAHPGKYRRAWRTGDVAALEDIDQQMLKEYPEFKPAFESAFERPAAALAEELGNLVKASRTPFAMIPCGYLIGEKGMVRVLRDRNFEVEQMGGDAE